MTLIRGIWGAVDTVAAAYQNDIEDYRAMLWDTFGRNQGILTGFTHTLDAGALTVTFAAGQAVIEQRGTDITGDGKAYHVFNDVSTTVPFNAPSASSRSDALVFAWADPQYGSIGASVTVAGPQIVVVQGVSGSTTPRTDAQIQTAIGVGGWFRYADVIIAPGNTSVQAGNFTDVHPSNQLTRGPKTSNFTVSGTLTRADRPQAIGAKVRCWSGGGGGGAGDGQGGQGESGGGAGGSYAEKWYNAAAWAALSKTITVTVGAGGVGGTASLGGTGGTTTFDTMSVPGGGGGSEMASTAGTAAALGGVAGTPTGGDVNIKGSDGGRGRVLAGAAVFAGCGGSAPNGGGAAYYASFGAGTGTAGHAPGGGGSGCFCTTLGVDQVGGAGAAGRVEVIEYF